MPHSTTLGRGEGEGLLTTQHTIIVRVAGRVCNERCTKLKETLQNTYSSSYTWWYLRSWDRFLDQVRFCTYIRHSLCSEHIVSAQYTCQCKHWWKCSRKNHHFALPTVNTWTCPLLFTASSSSKQQPSSVLYKNIKTARLCASISITAKALKILTFWGYGSYLWSSLVLGISLAKFSIPDLRILWHPSNEVDFFWVVQMLQLYFISILINFMAFKKIHIFRWVMEPFLFYQDLDHQSIISPNCWRKNEKKSANSLNDFSRSLLLPYQCQPALSHPHPQLYRYFNL